MKFLLSPDQVLEQWDSTLLDKSAGALEEAVLAAAQDAVGETRTAGRAAFAAYCRARPERLHPLLARQDPGLQQKLREALVAYVPGACSLFPSTDLYVRADAAAQVGTVCAGPLGLSVCLTILV